MCLRNLIRLSVLIIFFSCDEEPPTGSVPQTSSYAIYIGNSGIDYTEINRSVAYNYQIENEQYFLISYRATGNEKQLYLDLRHRYSIDSYLDFGYQATLNGEILDRYHQSLNYNLFSLSKQEISAEKTWSIESSGSNLVFFADEGKMIEKTEFQAKKPDLIRIENLSITSAIVFNDQFSIKLNREVNSKSTYLGFEIEQINSELQHFVFKLNERADQFWFSSEDLALIRSYLNESGSTSVKIWIESEDYLGSIQTTQKLTGIDYSTPVIFKSTEIKTIQLIR